MKEKMNKIPVFYACDDNFVKYTMVSLQSMMDHASKEVQYEIHVLHTNISEEMQKKMYAMENANFSVQFDHVTEYLHSIQEKLPLRDYYSKTTYFRLFIAENVSGNRQSHLYRQRYDCAGGYCTTVCL